MTSCMMTSICMMTMKTRLLWFASVVLLISTIVYLFSQLRRKIWITKNFDKACNGLSSKMTPSCKSPIEKKWHALVEFYQLFNWRDVWNKALSDFWCNVKFSSSFTTEFKEIWKENLVIYQKSLKAFLQAPLQLSSWQITMFFKLKSVV